MSESHYILGVSPGASPDEIKRAYRRLARLWHPDQFRKPEAQAEAQRRIRQINEAYAQLQGKARPSVAVSRPILVRVPVPAVAGSSWGWLRLTWKPALLMAAVYSMAVGVGTLAQKGFEGGWLAGTALPTSLPSVERMVLPRRPAALLSLGSSKDDARALVGEPTARSGEKWYYGYSWVEFAGQKLVRWDISPLSPLPLRLQARHAAPAAGHFRVGSDQDDVIALQGTPSAYEDDMWMYGASAVYFDHGRVVGWRSSRLVPLKVGREE